MRLRRFRSAGGWSRWTCRRPCTGSGATTSTCRHTRGSRQPRASTYGTGDPWASCPATDGQPGRDLNRGSGHYQEGERMNREATFERALEEFATAEDVGTVSAVAVAYEVYALRVVAPELAFENLSDDGKQAVPGGPNGET